jgi:hypothetical protein
VEYRRWPVKNRLEEIRKHMVTAVARKKDALMGKVERICAARVEAIKASDASDLDKRLQIIAAYDARDASRHS